MDFALLCDFDGTVTDIDTGRFLLDKFTERDRRMFISQYERGEITLEEYLRKQYSMLNVPKHLMLKELEKVTSIRPNFKELVLFCRMRDTPFIIVSAGLDFIIRYFMDQTGCIDLIDVYSVRTMISDNSIKVTFPKLLDETSIDFKEDLVKHYKKRGYKTIYIGDGVSDYGAVRNADFSFIIKGSELTNFCKKNGIPHKEISDFQEVIDAIKTFPTCKGELKY